MSDYLEETDLGTVVRPEWDEPYFKQVITAERAAKRAICGSPKKDGDPCKGRATKEFGYYCRLHKHSGELQLSSQEAKDPSTALTIEKQPRPPVLLNDEIRHALMNCNICVVRRNCTAFIAGHYCTIEERAVHQFIDTVKEDFKISDLDMFSVLQAAFSWIAAIRARISQSRMDPVDAEASRISWQAPREMKEYTRMMKELGLTRKERIDQEKDRMGPASVTASASLAEVMSALQLNMANEVTVTQAVQTTVRKKTEDDIIDVEAEDPDADVEHA